MAVEFISDVDYFVACSERFCSLVNYLSNLNLERRINLGEKADSIFWVHNKALLGVVDSSRNSIAYYFIEEATFINDGMIAQVHPL